MSGDNPNYAEAVWIKDGKIAYIGSLKDVKSHAGGAEEVNLDGKTLLPSFIDPHSHYINSLSVANQADVSPAPIGPGKDVSSIIETIKKFQDDHKVPKGEIIQAYGYDDTMMPDHRVLNRDDLDEAFPDNPVIVGHISMHGAVLNSSALKKFNITSATPTPSGGVIVRKPGTQEPYGLIMETAYLPIFDNLPKPTPQQEIEWSKAGQMMYAQAGITTAHDGATKIGDIEIMDRVTKAGGNMIDIIAFPFITDLDAILAKFPKSEWGKYNNRFKIGGVKITIDGSPQGKTAAFTTPYLTGGPGGEKDWKGETTFPEPMIHQMIKKVYAMDVPLNLHANGDGAIDVFLRAHEEAAKDDLGKERHVTMIHSQFVRKDQLAKYPLYKILPSFYTLHTFYFADAHLVNRGKSQTMYMSPMKDAIALGLKPTNHTDFVVLPLDQMMVVWSSVNRVSRAGVEIGKDQSITPYQGLQAITINPAIQYQEQSSKGSLEKGKLADIVILDQNPLKVAPEKIKDIKVLQTLKEGKVIYCKECNAS
ncbi:metal-dependent hydrolase [Elizabethkingia ursingii]|uniref:Metal-dependent hydrolase n=2 Tax=Weeksellaceae TaxID=2762318 RepID=A0AAJ3NEN3_9FLAO|nr:metal-dependent hydrolase [Elizabethkingia anophelis]AQX10790.1 metal-dependent hydrolase [Elizabethkingia ursingii]OPB60835.1 metal-dependent hydrolase [Elizabethkingia anophelis]OPB78953.1 metal-dependent hydrolase [Elizabethkingia ursingii]OPB91638.1 metal-dependent hydrolase [Elizabethkingia ursingii]